LPESLDSQIQEFRGRLAELNSVNQYLRDMVINIDQTAIYHGQTRTRTFNQKGARTVRVLENPNSSVRSTALLKVTLSGTKLKPLLIFKGKRNGTISRRIAEGRVDLPTELCYAVQDNAWADENVMIEFTRSILEPYVRELNCLALLILVTGAPLL
jgi:hypothetical protein